MCEHEPEMDISMVVVLFCETIIFFSHFSHPTKFQLPPVQLTSSTSITKSQSSESQKTHFKL